MEPGGAWCAWTPSSAAREPAPSRARSLGPAPRGGERGAWPEEPAAHVPCLLRETVDLLLGPERRDPSGKYDGTYVDCTFGRGGHSREILSRLSARGRLYAFDVDPEAVAAARQLEAEDARFRIIHRPFGDLGEVFSDLNAPVLDGVMADLGVSSPQLDDAHRGFNIWDSRAPDMRMNQSTGITASEWMQGITAEELAWVIHAYGEDDDSLLSERIAEHILARQREEGGSIRSNKWLSNIVRQAKGGYDDNMHPAKLTFQALRVFLNQEMQQLDRLLEGALDRLVEGGRLAIITFKKKEANAVRKFVREHEEPDSYLNNLLAMPRLCELYPLLLTDKAYSVEQIGCAVKASWEEVERNRRSRSSAVHLLKKLPRRSPVLRAATRPASDRFREPRGVQLQVVPPSLPQAAPPLPQAAPPPLREELPPPLPPSEGPPPPQAAPPPAGPAAAAERERGPGEKVELPARAVREFDENMAGYLQLRRGDALTVLYQGTEGEDAGWSYGLMEGTFGWFPSACVESLWPDQAG